MMNKILFLALLLSIGLGSPAMADLVDEFDVAHDYLVDGVAGTDWSALMNGGNATILDASTTSAGVLSIESTGYWGGGDTSGPFLYKEVTGDFIAELHMNPYTGTDNWIGGGLMVRLGDPAADGNAGEDNMLLFYWPLGFDVGSIFWPTNDNVRPEYNNSADGINGPTYFRVERRGADFYWSRSYDGTTWEEVDGGGYPYVREDMNVATLQVGVVESFGDWLGDPTTDTTIEFDYIKITEQVTAFSGTKTVSEDGVSTTIAVDLVGPAHTAQVDVVLTEVTTGDPNDLLLGGAQSPLTLSFPVGVTQQTFEIQAVDDALQEGPETVTITTEVSSADSNYADHPAGSLTINVIDNEPGLLIDEGDGVSVDEDGSISDSFSIVLSTAPTADVTVTLTPDAQLNVTSPLVFTSTDWNVPQSATVTAVDDTDLEDDPHTGTISFSTSSSDPDYEGQTAFDVVATIAENECGAWEYSPYDYNQDCVVNLADLAILASQWGQCTVPYAVDCIDVR